MKFNWEHFLERTILLLALALPLCRRDFCGIPNIYHANLHGRDKYQEMASIPVDVPYLQLAFHLLCA